MWTYHIPVGDFGLEDMLDGNVLAVPESNPGVDGAEAALAEDVPDNVGDLEGFSRMVSGVFFHA